MNYKFYKYQGTGNDFILVDNRAGDFPKASQMTIAQLCHRRFGIGADGFILLQNHEQADFEMVYFNADGHVGSMCGNGGRCTASFAHFLGIFGEKSTFWASDGLHYARISADGLVTISLRDVTQVEQITDGFFLDTGSPHYIAFVENLAGYPVLDKGRQIRHAYREGGTNVNFLEKLGDTLHVRTFERGVEDETLSCGTGVTAAAIAANLTGMQSPIKISTLGGYLKVAFKKNGNTYRNIELTGAAVQVFSGEIEVLK